MRGIGRTLEERLRIEAEMTISMFMRRDKHTIGAARVQARRPDARVAAPRAVGRTDPASTLSPHARVVARGLSCHRPPHDDVVDIPGDMRSLRRPGDRGIAALATRQHGVVSHGQLERLGVSRGAIQHRLRAGRLHRMHRGVYSVGHRRVSAHGRSMAAILACGPDAVLSHRSAAALWGLRPSARPVTDVTTPGRSRRAEGGHRRSTWCAIWTSGIAPSRTGCRSPRWPARFSTSPRRCRRMTWGERWRQPSGSGCSMYARLEEVVDRCRGRRGLRPLRLALETYRPAPDTRSELERRFARLCRDAGLPRPAVNVLVAGILVDAVWQDRMLVVELDGRAYHGTREAFERDRIRDATLQVAGYRVLRLTHRRLLREPGHVVRTIRLLLTARPAPSARVEPVPLRSCRLRVSTSVCGEPSGSWRRCWSCSAIP